MFKPRKVGWSDYGRRGLHEGERNCLKYLKRGWNRKGEGKQRLKKKGRSKLGQAMGALKMGAWNPLTNYAIPQHFFTFLFLRTAILASVFLPQPFNQFRLRQATSEQGSLARTDTVLISVFSLKVWTEITGFTITDSLSLRFRKLVYSR